MPPAILFKTAAKPDLDLVNIIRGGLPASSFNQLATALGIPRHDLAKKLGLGLRTVNRQIQSRGRLSADMTERVIRGARIRNQARTIFTDDEAISEWLASPASALGGVKPIDLIDTDVGARTVEALLQGIAHGNVI